MGRFLNSGYYRITSQDEQRQWKMYSSVFLMDRLIQMAFVQPKICQHQTISCSHLERHLAHVCIVSFSYRRLVMDSSLTRGKQLNLICRGKSTTQAENGSDSKQSVFVFTFVSSLPFCVLFFLLAWVATL